MWSKTNDDLEDEFFFNLKYDDQPDKVVEKINTVLAHFEIEIIHVGPDGKYEIRPYQ